MERQELSDNKELTPIPLNDTCVVGSVLFKDYSLEGSEGNIRGKEAIESLCNIAKKGCKAAFLITEGTDEKFIEDLKNKLETIGEKSENIVWRIEEERGYSGMRREAIKFARSKYPEARAYIIQEIEKDLSENYQEFIDTLSNQKILVLMNRGINIPYNDNPWPDVDHIGANLPKAQFWGERHQNIEMANQEIAAGLTKDKHFWDRLNGTRIIRNEKVLVNGMEFNPADLMLLEYKYSDGYDEKDRKNSIDRYSAYAYNIIPILEALGVEDWISDVPVKYLHPEEQRRHEEDNPKYKERRLGHKVDLPAINLDIVKNIQKWKEEGLWPDVLVKALRGDKIVQLEHFER